MQNSSGTQWRLQPASSLESPVLSSHWLEAQHVQVGLQNMGNTCYCNSVLACLAFLPPLANLLRGCVSGLALHHGAACHVPAPQRCAACLFTKQLLAMLTTTPRILKPVHIVTNLPIFSKTFRRGRQEDSHEFFHCLLDAVERDSKQASNSNSGKANKQGVHTLIEYLFQGRSMSQVRCLECGHESNTFELFCSLSLDIGKAATIHDSLAMFSAVESLEGANKYKCDKCKALVRARKQVAIWDDPNVLTVHLKRFSSGFSAAAAAAKLGRHVAFPPTLDLEPYMAHSLMQAQQEGAGARARAAPAHYRLSGVLVHQGGSMHSGHYYAYVCDSGGAWSCVNDELVQRVALSDVLQQQAYMLFYVRAAMKRPRQPPPAPGAEQAAAAPMPFGPAPRPEAAGSGFIGPELPPASHSPGLGKRSRGSFEEQEAVAGSLAVPSRDVEPRHRPGNGQVSTTVLPSGAKTTVLPAKLPARLPTQQQKVAAAAPLVRAGNGPGVAPFTIRIGARAAAKAAANGSAGRASLAPAAAAASRQPAAAAAAHAATTNSPQTSMPGPQSGAPVPVSPRGSGGRGREQPASDRERLKAEFLEALRASKYGAAVRERLESHFTAGLSAAASPQLLLDQRLQEIHTDAGVAAMRAELRLLLARLEPGFISEAKERVRALL